MTRLPELPDELVPGHHGAFLREGFGAPPLPDAAPTDAPLAGLRLAVKDVFDVQGLHTGNGSPLWRAHAQPATDTATAVQLLLLAGAAWVGKTVTDELTYSLAGINAHHGTPVNPAAPDRIPGGSSSGSAVAVAAGHADVGLGTDCGGSVRVPASYCGLWGLRPTHGRLATHGCFALAHSFDTVGWFARDGRTLARVFEVLAHSRVDTQAPPPTRLCVAPELDALLDEPVRAHVHHTLRQLGAHLAIERLPAGTLNVAAWAEAFRPLQAAEVWQRHGPWFERHGASMGADIRQRFERAARVDAATVAAAQQVRQSASATLATLLGPGCYLLLPTLPMPAPGRGDSAEAIDTARVRGQSLLCMAGLAGLPQVSMPWVAVDGAPVGLSLIGGRGGDEALLGAAMWVHAAQGSSG